MNLYERNFIKAINTKAMGSVSYSMYICYYTLRDLKDLDIKMRHLLCEKRTRGLEESSERLYMSKSLNGRGLISFEMMYKMSKLLIAIYLCLTNDNMLKEVFKRERRKATWKNPLREAEIAVEEVGHSLSLLEGEVVLDGKRMGGNPKYLNLGHAQLMVLCNKLW